MIYECKSCFINKGSDQCNCEQEKEMTTPTKAALYALGVIEHRLRAIDGLCSFESEYETIRAALTNAPEVKTTAWMTAFLHGNDDYLTENECKRVSKLLTGFKYGVKIVEGG